MMRLRILPAPSGRDQTGGHTGPLHSHAPDFLHKPQRQRWERGLYYAAKDTSHGFPKSNVIFKTCAPLSQRNSVHATEDTRYDVRSKIFILFYSSLFYSVVSYSIYIWEKGKWGRMTVMPLPGDKSSVQGECHGSWSVGNGVLLSTLVPMLLLHRSSGGEGLV